MKTKLYLLITTILLSSASWAQDWKIYPYTPKESLISFPADEGRHTSQPVEWWYTTGNLTGNTSGKTYSYMLTYFYYPIAGYDGFRILNLTDDASGTFYQDSKPLNYTYLSTSGLDIHASIYDEGNETWSNKVDTNNKVIPFEYSLNAASPNVGLNLDYVTLKRPLIISDSGYLLQGISDYTYYYSQTKNAVSGTLTLNGATEGVTGTSWIDRQYGNFNPWTGEKYEWFHAQLSNGMDINFWNIFTANNTIPDNSRYRLLSAYVNDSTQYTVNNLTIQRLGYNWMPDSAMCYSDKWRLTSPTNNIDLTITTKNNNTEVQLPFRFFEGATTISGTVNGVAVTGLGFAELLHSYAEPEMIIKNPVGGTYNTSSPIVWQLINPDDGDLVTYDIEYSIDNKDTFTPLAEGLTDTSYQWNNSALHNGDKVWFKITAHSIDDKLQSTIISSTSSSVIMNPNNVKIKLYPNPVGDNLFIEPAFQMNNSVCKIIDINGRVMQTFKSNSISDNINVSYLSAGVYFFKIGTGKGQNVIKFIKK
ncbi:MAG TPA: lipocalin-like domain-containing protein [Hanamia sp.]|nr:lipocalin-like domain-containing protein [Hanamia sp.]